MSKRSREVITTVRPSLASLPYSTIDGGRWLKKALDPVDINTEVSGLPDINTNQRAILNYQMQDDIPVPRSETFNPNVMQSYDADLYLYQDPIVYGMSVSYPQSTKNPAEFPITIDINLDFNADTNTRIVDCIVKLASGTSPRTYNVFYNNQIEGSTVSQKLDSLQRYCQRSRIIYGGIQAIPACSALFDSGTIEATQQIFSPENKMVTNLNTSSSTGVPYRCQVFKPNDYPDEGSSIQNATSLYCRYKEGLYMPYKLVNPLVYPYKGSEEKCLIEAPFIFTGVYPRASFFRKASATSANLTTGYADFSYDVETNSYKATYTYTPADERFVGVQFYIECVSKFGQKFYLEIEPDKHTPPNQVKDFHGSFSLELPKTMGAYPHATSDLINQANSQPMTPDPSPADENCTLRCTYITLNPYQTDTLDTVTFMLPQISTNIGVVCFRSIGLQASVRLIFRVGLEMMIVAGGVYSPFKHKSPNYDQKALNSYVRACHNMRDAFLGNAATPEGHDDYAAHIAEIVASDDSSNISNMGSRWYGKVSV